MTWPLIFALAIWSPAAVVMPATVAPSTSQVVHSGCRFAAAQTRIAMEMMPPKAMESTASKRASEICSGSFQRSAAEEACRNRLYGTMVVPTRPMAVIRPVELFVGRCGVNMPEMMAPQSGLEASAVTRKTTPMNTTMAVSTFSMRL